MFIVLDRDAADRVLDLADGGRRPSWWRWPVAPGRASTPSRWNGRAAARRQRLLGKGAGARRARAALGSLAPEGRAGCRQSPPRAQRAPAQLLHGREAEHGAAPLPVPAAPRRRVGALRGPGSQRLLEVGCGLGRYTLPLARRGFEVEGIDISPALLERLRASLPHEAGVTLHLADVLDLKRVVRPLRRRHRRLRAAPPPRRAAVAGLDGAWPARWGGSHSQGRTPSTASTTHRWRSARR